MAYAIVLQGVKVARRIRRRLFRGVLPHWARDIARAIRWLNFLTLLPTLLAVPMDPSRFFKRLGRVLEGHSSLHATPIAFLSRSIALVVAMLFATQTPVFSAFGISKAQAQAALFALTLLTPVWASVLAAVVWVGYLVFANIGYGSRRLGAKVNSHALLLSLYPETYMMLDWRRYWWGACYFAVWSYVALQIVLAASVGIFRLAAATLDAMAAQRAGEYPFDTGGYVGGVASGYPEATLLGNAGLIITALLHLLVVTPYGKFLRASLKRPTRAVFASDIARVEQSLNGLRRHFAPDLFWAFKRRTSVDSVADQLDRLRGPLLLAMRNRLREDVWRQPDEREEILRDFQIEILRRMRLAEWEAMLARPEFEHMRKDSIRASLARLASLARAQRGEVQNATITGRNDTVVLRSEVHASEAATG